MEDRLWNMCLSMLTIGRNPSPRVNSNGASSPETLTLPRTVTITLGEANNRLNDDGSRVASSRADNSNNANVNNGNGRTNMDDDGDMYHLSVVSTRTEHPNKDPAFSWDNIDKDEKRGIDNFWKSKPKDVSSKHHLITNEPLFRLSPPRQYIFQGRLYRPPKHRSTSPLELFWDLTIVGAIYTIGHILSMRATTLELANIIGYYIIIYSILWKLWLDVHYWTNMFGTNDIFHRAFVIWQLTLVVGIGVNFDIFPHEKSFQFTICYALSKFTFAIIYAIHLSYLWHQFRVDLLIRIGCYLVPGILALFNLFSEERIAIWSVICGIDYILPWCVKYVQNIAIDRGYSPRYLLALDPDHHKHRHGEYILISIGEFGLGVFYKSSGSFDYRFGKLALSIALVSCLHWLYFECEESRQIRHALKRARWSTFVWNVIHVILGMSLVATTTSLSMLVGFSSGEVATNQLVWMFGLGLGITLISLTILGISHKSLESEKPTRIKKKYRLTARAIVGIFMTLIPFLYDPLEKSETRLIAIYSTITIAQTVFEMFGRLKLNAVERVENGPEFPRSDSLFTPPFRFDSIGLDTQNNTLVAPLTNDSRFNYPEVILPETPEPMWEISVHIPSFELSALHHHNHSLNQKDQNPARIYEAHSRYLNEGDDDAYLYGGLPEIYPSGGSLYSADEGKSKTSFPQSHPAHGIINFDPPPQLSFTGITRPETAHTSSLPGGTRPNTASTSVSRPPTERSQNSVLPSPVSSKPSTSRRLGGNIFVRTAVKFEDRRLSRPLASEKNPGASLVQ
ncbi:hypothetical protein H4219_002079 [Mycoemilia scoparia]|uniref:Uncharacterized protein n=1 Tax=Mycoemilia scoparia TaxID=417184 RepID=A0A9W8A533_9FUNG|nr:hypothetical protein H4219_002079 [Mycoemilia scoparia]